MNLNRSFERNSDNITTTTINGKIYRAEFDDLSGLCTIKDDKGEILSEFNILEKLTSEGANNSKDDIKKFIGFIKNVPADALLKMGKFVKTITVIPFGSRKSTIFCEDGILKTECTLSAFLHEMGHIEGFKDEEYLLNDNELIEIYDDEMFNFKKKFPDIMHNIIYYFSQTGGGESDTGLDEFIAETALLLGTYGNNDELSNRAHYLVKYFPKTVACIAGKLGYNQG